MGKRPIGAALGEEPSCGAERGAGERLLCRRFGRQRALPSLSSDPSTLEINPVTHLRQQLLNRAQQPCAAVSARERRSLYPIETAGGI